MTESSAASLEHLMRSMFSNTTMNMMMTVSYEITEMLMDMVETYEGMYCLWISFYYISGKKAFRKPLSAENENS